MSASVKHIYFKEPKLVCPILGVLDVTERECMNFNSYGKKNQMGHL